MAANRSIGVLGGTFDPVHNGHIAIAKSFLRSGYIDSLLILLTPKPPHKPDREFANYNQRLRMLIAAFRSLDKVKVSDLEFTLPKPSFTYQTLHYLKKNCPGRHFYLCLGEDSFIDFKKWNNWQGILEHSELLVARRPGAHGHSKDEELRKFTHFVNHEPLDVSSSLIREKIENNESVEDLVPGEVLKIIEKNDLYKM